MAKRPPTRPKAKKGKIARDKTATEVTRERAISSAISQRGASADNLDGLRHLRKELTYDVAGESVRDALKRLREKTSRKPFTSLELAFIVSHYKDQYRQEDIGKELGLKQPRISRLLRLHERVSEHDALRDAVADGTVDATRVMEHTKESWPRALREFDETGDITPRWKTTSVGRKKVR